MRPSSNVPCVLMVTLGDFVVTAIKELTLLKRSGGKDGLWVIIDGERGQSVSVGVRTRVYEILPARREGGRESLHVACV